MSPYSEKYIFDSIMAIFAIILFAPIIALVALILYLYLGIDLPILFCQIRAGIRGKPFIMYKFRTMNNDRDENGSLLTDEKRLRSFGRILRSVSLDELPTFWNVLRGDMSLVGPRPLLMQYLCRYTPEQARRNEVKPGITGWAQVNGRNALTWEERFKLDVWYVDHVSFWLDMKILAMTLWKVIRREGINQEGQATMSEFMGNGNSGG